MHSSDDFLNRQHNISNILETSGKSRTLLPNFLPFSFTLKSLWSEGSANFPVSFPFSLTSISFHKIFAFRVLKLSSLSQGPQTQSLILSLFRYGHNPRMSQDWASRKGQIFHNRRCVGQRNRWSPAVHRRGAETLPTLSQVQNSPWEALSAL